MSRGIDVFVKEAEELTKNIDVLLVIRFSHTKFTE